MNNETSLEQQLRFIIGEYRRLKEADTARLTLHEEQELLIADLKEQNAQLRKSIDILNADRFSVKRLKDERKAVRRKVNSALNRMETLEQEVAHVLDQ